MGERAQEKQAFSERKITFRNCTYYSGVLCIEKAGKVKPAAALGLRYAGPSGCFETIIFFHSLISFKMDKHPS